MLVCRIWRTVCPLMGVAAGAACGLAAQVPTQCPPSSRFVRTGQWRESDTHQGEQAGHGGRQTTGGAAAACSGMGGFACRPRTFDNNCAMDFTACLLGLLWFGTRTRPSERGWMVSLRSGATLVQSGCTSVILVSPFAGVALVTSVSVHAQ